MLRLTAIIGYETGQSEAGIKKEFFLANATRQSVK
jgi:hypothetical protein